MAETSASKTALSRGMRGAIEGAGYGVAVAAVRLVLAWLRDAEDFPSHLGEIALYSAGVILGAAYAFGVGRAISGGWFGALAGAAVFSIAGALVGGIVATPAMEGPPLPILGGAAVGFVIGAVVGAFIERVVSQWIARRRERQTAVADPS